MIEAYSRSLFAFYANDIIMLGPAEETLATIAMLSDSLGLGRLGLQVNLQKCSAYCSGGSETIPNTIPRDLPRVDNERVIVFGVPIGGGRTVFWALW